MRTPFLLLGLAACVCLAGCGAGSEGSVRDGGVRRGQASPRQFWSERFPTRVTDRQGEAVIFTVPGGGWVACRLATYAAVLRHPAEILALHPVYRGCRSTGRRVTISTRECDFLLGPGASRQAALRIACRGGGAIRMRFGSCAFEIPSQEPAGDVQYLSTGQGRSRTFDANALLPSLAFTESRRGACPDADGADAKLELSLGIELYGGGAEGGPVGIWLQ